MNDRRIHEIEGFAERQVSPVRETLLECLNAIRRLKVQFLYVKGQMEDLDELFIDSVNENAQLLQERSIRKIQN